MTTFHLINLRDDYSNIEPFYNLYNELPEFLKEVLNLNNQFIIWYKNISPIKYRILNQIHNIVDIYYDYEQILFTLDDIYNIYEQINTNDLKSILDPLYKKIEEKINKEQLKYTSHNDLIKRKQKSIYDLFYEISKSKTTSDDIDSIYPDILTHIEEFCKDKKEQSAQTLFLNDILTYIYKPKLWYFKNYIHHLRNIYLGIRFYLQKDYMFNRFDKNYIFNCDKYFCYAKDSEYNILMGFIINRYKLDMSDEYLQEHIFISSNIKIDIFINKSSELKIPNLSMQLHKFGSEIEPKAKQIYCNPLPSMLTILQKANNYKIIKLNILTNEERDYIENLKIMCFKFIPTVSISFIN
jgi:hypothetical protein